MAHSHTNVEPETVVHPEKRKKVNKKRRASSDRNVASARDIEDSGNTYKEAMDGARVDDNLDEPTMGEKLANLSMQGRDQSKIQDQSLPTTEPPSADSVYALLKQALRADDRALLLDCLYSQDAKVIGKSTSFLNPSDALKLLNFLISILHSRGAVLVCAIPWLRSLLLQHASGIMSQESSLLALNSLYQLINSRVSTFQPALQLSSCIDLLYAGSVEEGAEEGAVAPIIYEDKDESGDEESEDSMDADQENENVEPSDDDIEEEEDGMVE